ncbi:unnamed protein product [Cylindrotheca closterium]|uniref:Alpha-galactosidase n=1 Tax=Cylindrotheca closterium TaxID=2856 RepID=A0AAD2JGQ6_9STRA|nr:unnamed protein product [Cylindrotheca closterium]
MDNGLGLTPPMGWNSWNRFACNIQEDLIKDTVQAAKSLGLDRLGYVYINLDDCWQKSRNKYGYIVEDKKAFPSGIPALAEYIHDQGMKFGLYSDAGLFTCQKRPGSLKYEAQDAATYKEWKIDYLKYDNCWSTLEPVQHRYQTMHDALNKTGHSIFFSMCEWGVQDPATWAPSIGNSWRTTGDINPTWKSWTSILDANDKWWQQAGPGGWNDPDMLEVDNGRMTFAEQKAHFTMWCLIKAPLLLGMDLRKISKAGLEIISNEGLIQWNQDTLGVQGHRVYQEKVESTAVSPSSSPLLRQRRLDGSMVQTITESESELEGGGGDGLIEVWAGPLANGNYAVVLFNRGRKPHSITADWKDIGLPSAQAMKATDVWKKQSIGTFASNYTAMVEPHDVIAIQLEPAFLE